MRRFRLPLLIIPVILLLSTCEQFDPHWMGTWVDDSPVPFVVITLVLDEWEGTVTVENSDPDHEPKDAKRTVVKGSLDGDENTLIATITSIYEEYWDGTDRLVTDPIVIYLYVTMPPTTPPDPPGGLGLQWPCSASYVIEGDTITLIGQLILALTKNELDMLTATKQ